MLNKLLYELLPALYLLFAGLLYWLVDSPIRLFPASVFTVSAVLTIVWRWRHRKVENPAVK